MRLLLRADRKGPLRFAPVAGVTGTGVLAAHPELTGIESLIFVESDRITIKSTAVLRLFRYLGGLWRLLLIGYLIPREIRDSIYDVVAYWRYRVFGRTDTCPVPPPEDRSRFLP